MSDGDAAGGRAGADPVGPVFRAAWSAVVASTARLTRDLDLAEDAAAEAIERAVRTWGATPPERPAAWLTTVAHRVALDRLRRETTLRRKLPLLVEPPEAADEAPGTDLLGLVFTCCHPALAPESQVALTLRLVCGLEVPVIAAVLLAGEAGVARRITRAKRKIATAGIPLRVPSPAERSVRLDAVLTVISLVHTAGHVGAGPGLRDVDVGARAVELARTLARLLPGEPEVRGLLALVLLTDARGPARTGPGGDLVLLADQDRSLWDRALVREGLALATSALRDGPRGRYALQAAIAGLHAMAPRFDDTDWAQVVVTHDALMATWPSPVVALNRAVARGRLAGADLDAALAEVDALAEDLPRYAYRHAARGHLLAGLGRAGEAAAAYGAALALTGNVVERRFLARRVSELRGEVPGD